MASRRSTPSRPNGAYQAGKTLPVAALVLIGSCAAQERQDRLLRQHAMTCVGNDALLRAGDNSEHLDSVLRCDDVGVADDQQNGYPDAPQLLGRKARFHDPRALKPSKKDWPMVCSIGERRA